MACLVILGVSCTNIVILQPDEDSSSRASDDWNYRRPRSSYSGNGRGRWNDSIPNNIILMRGLPEEAVESDVSYPYSMLGLARYQHFNNQY